MNMDGGGIDKSLNNTYLLLSKLKQTAPKVSSKTIEPSDLGPTGF